MTLITAKWTVEDYHRMIATGILAGRHVELLNGEIVEMVKLTPWLFLILRFQLSDY